MSNKIKSKIRKSTPKLVKSTIGSVACNPFFGRLISWYYNDKIPYGKNKICTESSLIDSSSKASLFWNRYEVAEARFIEKYLSSQNNVVELGGGIGAISCKILEKIGPNNKLIVVEANVGIVETARSNIRNNYPGSNCFVLNRAICEPDENAAKFREGEKIVSGTTNRLEEEGISVDCISVEKLSKMVNKEYSLVSDIEGGEMHFIMSSVRLNKCTEIIIELHEGYYKGSYISEKYMIKKIVQKGFSLVDKHGPVCVFKRD